MKTKLITMIAMAVIFQSKSAFAVENAIEAVDKEYQHELICQASTEAENFELNLKWSVEYMHVPDGRAPVIKKEFKSELKNLNSGLVIQDHYGNFFGEYAEIKATDEAFHAVGQFFMYKRLGYIEKKTDILLSHDGAGGYDLKSYTKKAIETFENPIDYCHPATRLCGSEPPLPEPKIVVSHIFVHSNCQLVK